MRVWLYKIHSKIKSKSCEISHKFAVDNWLLLEIWEQGKLWWMDTNRITCDDTNRITCDDDVSVRTVQWSLYLWYLHRGTNLWLRLQRHLHHVPPFVRASLAVINGAELWNRNHFDEVMYMWKLTLYLLSQTFFMFKWRIPYSNSL